MGRYALPWPVRFTDKGIVRLFVSGVNVMGPIGDRLPWQCGELLPYRIVRLARNNDAIRARARMGDCGVWATVRMGNSTGDVKEFRANGCPTE